MLHDRRAVAKALLALFLLEGRAGGKCAAPRPAAASDMKTNATFEEIGGIISRYHSFVILSHVRPDGDAIGSQLALGLALEAADKRVVMLNEDGVPDSLAFLRGAEKIITPPDGPVEAEVVIALDTATRPRLGDKALLAVKGVPLWVNIDHHISNPRYGHVNYIDAKSPATGQIIYDLLLALGLPFPDETRDAIYVAVSTDTGSFQYPSTTAKTYELAADLLRRGLDVGTINSQTYDNHPFRRIQLLQALLNTLGLASHGRVAHWDLTGTTRHRLRLSPEDSEGLIDHIRAIRGVIVAVFFEEMPDGKIRVSMRSKDKRVDVCVIASQFGGGGHALAAGLRMPGPLDAAKERVLSAIDAAVVAAGL